jgi:hypothetical protein
LARRQGWWVIVARQKPTAFRARQRDLLIPTLRQLQRRHPDAALKWFDRGRFWDSPAEATAALRARRARKRRPADWRPGGDHKDPRARFKLTREQKRARFRRRLRSGTTAGAKGRARGKGRG